MAGLLVTEEVPLAVLGTFLTNFELPVLLPEVLAAQVGCSCGAVALNLIECWGQKYRGRSGRIS